MRSDDFEVKDGELIQYKGSAEHVVVPDDVTVIGEYAFFRSRMTSISLPKKLKKIKNNAFASSSLREIEIPDSVTTIGKQAFMWSCVECVKLPPKLGVLSDEVFKLSHLREIDIPKGVKTIKKQAFESCFCLETVSLPETLKKIEYGAFYGCNKLSEINYDVCKDIGENTFGLCDGLEGKDGFIVLNGVLYESSAMYKNETVALPDNVIEIDRSTPIVNSDVKYTVNGKPVCNFCKKVIIPKSVEYYGSRAFSWQDLKEIECKSHADIKEYAFYSCKKLEKLTVPKGTNISEKAFGTGENELKRFEKLKIEFV